MHSTRRDWSPFFPLDEVTKKKEEEKKKIKSRPYLEMYLVSVMAIYRRVRVIFSIIIIHDQDTCIYRRNPKRVGEGEKKYIEERMSSTL